MTSTVLSPALQLVFFRLNGCRLVNFLWTWNCLLTVHFKSGVRWSLHSPEGTRAGVGREGQEVHQRLHQELWGGSGRGQAQGDLLQIRQNHFIQSGKLSVSKLFVEFGKKILGFDQFVYKARNFCLICWILTVVLIFTFLGPNSETSFLLLTSRLNWFLWNETLPSGGHFVNSDVQIPSSNVTLKLVSFFTKNIPCDLKM